MKQIIVMFFFTFFVNNIHAGDVSKDVWVKSFQARFSSYVCFTQEYKSVLVDKYGISELKCSQLMDHAVSLCIERYDSVIPLIIKGNDGSKFGSLVGACSQRVYEVSLKN